MPQPYFPDRVAAGRELAQKLNGYAGEPGVMILGLPRGGVPVAFEVAEALGAELDAFLVRKLGVPGQEELAMGAIASGGGRVLNQDVIAQLGISGDMLERVVLREQRELRRREQLYRQGRPPLQLLHRTVILVDDGLATGATMLVAVRAVRSLGAGKVIVAVPVASRQAGAEMMAEADDYVCLATPEPFYGISAFYRDFSPTSDQEVQDLLARSRAPRHAA